MNGILLVNKPENITSFSVVNMLKKKFRFKKAGHAGTIDRFASGLLIVGVDEGTKILNYYMDKDKVYEAEFTLGTMTETLDPEGAVVARSEDPLPGIDEIVRAAKRLTGVIRQVPPLYSAIKIKGKRASERTREGETIRLAPRTVSVHDIEILGYAPPLLQLRISCGKGTYIRSLARDLGELLGCGAHVSRLVRTAVGPHGLREAHSVDQLLRRDDLSDVLVPLADCLPFMFRIHIDEDGRADILKGRPLRLSDAPGLGTAFALCRGKALAIVHIDRAGSDFVVRPDRILYD